MKLLLGLISLFFVLNLFAAELDGIKFDDKMIVANKELILNGIGIRKATIFKVKVYYGGLYLEKKSNDYNSFATTNSPKAIVMNFVHEVDAKKLKNAFSEAFENANKNHANFKVQMEKFNNCVVDVIQGDKYIITFNNDGVQLTTKMKVCDKVGGADFSQALLSIWFVNPIDEALKAGLLSK